MFWFQHVWLARLIMAGCGLGPLLIDILTFFNRNFQTFPEWVIHLDFQNNGPLKNPERVAQILQYCSFSSLDCSSTDLPGLALVLQFINRLRGCLIVSTYTVHPSPGQCQFPCSGPTPQLLLCSSFQYLLDQPQYPWRRASSGPYSRWAIGKILSDHNSGGFFSGFSTNVSITTFDFTAQACGDWAWSILCRALQSNQVLSTVKARGSFDQRQHWCFREQCWLQWYPRLAQAATVEPEYLSRFSTPRIVHHSRQTLQVDSPKVPSHISGPSISFPLGWITPSWQCPLPSLIRPLFLTLAPHLFTVSFTP